MATVTKERKQSCLEHLRALLKPDDTVYGVIRSVSRSGMSRRIDFYAMKDGEPHFITAFLADLGLGSYSAKAWARQEGMRVDGCGMDMIFHVVYELSRILFPTGFPVTNEDGTPKRGRNGDMSGWDNDGGYALRHSRL